MTPSRARSCGRTPTRRSLLAAFATLAALTACGGGGADPFSPTGSSVNAPAPALPAAGSPGLHPGAVARVHVQAAGPQVLRAIGATADGGYGVAWVDLSGAPTLRLRRFDMQGVAAGPERPIALGAISPDQLAVAVLPGGHLALAFVRTAPASQAEPWITRTSVVVQRYDADSLQLGPERELAAVAQNRIGASTMRYLAQPSIVRWDDGRFLAGWALIEEDGNGRTPQFWTQQVDPAGEPVGAPVLAGRGEVDTGYRLDAAPGGGHLLTTFGRVMGRTYLQYTAWDGAVAPALPAGALGVAEGSLLLPLVGGPGVLVSPAGSGASVQVYAPNGQAQGHAIGLAAMPVALAALGDGGWVAFTAAASGPLQAQRFDAGGNRIGAAFEAASPGAVPQPAALARGGLGLAWTDGGAGSADVMTQTLLP